MEKDRRLSCPMSHCPSVQPTSGQRTVFIERWSMARSPSLSCEPFSMSIFANSCIYTNYVSRLVPCPTVPRTSTVDSGRWSVVSSRFNVQCSTVQLNTLSCLNADKHVQCSIRSIEDVFLLVEAWTVVFFRVFPCIRWFRSFDHGRHGRTRNLRGVSPMHEPLLTCGPLTRTIYSIFKEHREYTDSRIEHKHISNRQEAALSRYGRVGGIVSIVSILPICLDLAGLAGLAGPVKGPGWSVTIVLAQAASLLPSIFNFPCGL